MEKNHAVLSNSVYLIVITEQISILDLDATPTLKLRELALVTLRTAKFINQLVVQDGIRDTDTWRRSSVFTRPVAKGGGLVGPCPLKCFWPPKNCWPPFFGGPNNIFQTPSNN